MPLEDAGLASSWLRDLSDGYIMFDDDPFRRIPGPILVTESNLAPVLLAPDDLVEKQNPYFIGIRSTNGSPIPKFAWQEGEHPLRRTPLYEAHCQLGARIIPFAGWEMPVWYTSVVEEHQATRQAAGLFDVSHMGIFQAEGPDAVVFLDSVCGNDISALAIGESCYTHFLDPDANVIDDTLIYYREKDKYMVVVNASNDEKDWAWLNSVRSGAVLIDEERPWSRAYGRQVWLRNLRDPVEGIDQKIDIALQGPRSRDILLSLGCEPELRKKILGLKRTELCDARLGNFNLIISRTGYTGEKMAFELFIHPSCAVALWISLLEAGTPFGLKPCGLGARDSLRTEAGLPLYGHEMSGDLNLGVGEAGFSSYIKTYKPWFIGRSAFINREKDRRGVVIRFRFTEKGVRLAHLGDPVLDKKGRLIGKVTSCAIDREGFLTGQAFVEFDYANEETPLFIFQGAPKSYGKTPSELITGDRVILPTPAVVISRFPK